MKFKMHSKILYYFCVLILAFFFVLCPIFIHPKILNYNINSNFQKNQVQSYFLKMWNIDDFEGGSGNRATFLEKISRQFESVNKGVYIIVQNLSADEVFTALSNGDAPDLISFSHYSGYMLQNTLLDYKGEISVRQDLLEYAKLNGAIKAIPWYLSGYCLIGNNSNPTLSQNLTAQTMFSFNQNGKTIKPSVSVGLANNNLALLSVIKNGAGIAGLDNLVKGYDKISTFQAYNDYANKNSATVLLGTARDFYRIKNKISLGTMFQCEFAPLGSFSDLVGYIGIINKKNYNLSSSFIEYLTNQNSQNQLNTIGLFSTTYNKIYLDKDVDYSNFENILQRNLKSINIFMPQDEKEQLWKQSINAILGNNDSLNFVKKYL